jgi:arylsulfatase A-like enzyme
MPTLSKLAGYAPAADLKWDGRDIWPVISGAVETVEPRTMYIPFSPGNVLRHGDWKLIAIKGTKKDKAGKKELFHLGRDPYEKEDLSAREPERVKELEKLLEEMASGDVTTMPEDLEGFKEDPALGEAPQAKTPSAEK